MPLENACPPLAQGMVVDQGNGYKRMPLGMYDTVSRHVYPFRDVDEFWDAGEILQDYKKLITPLPHRLYLDYIINRETAAGETGIYYYQLYTAFFMWGVEYLGWDVFMIAAMTDPEGFREKFLGPAFEESLRLVRILCKLAALLSFSMTIWQMQEISIPSDWYDKYILPRYLNFLQKSGRQGKSDFVAERQYAELSQTIAGAWS